MGDRDEARGPREVAVTGGGAAPIEEPPPSAIRKGKRRRAVLGALLFLIPALVILGALVVYPIFFSVVRSLYDRTGDTFVGIENYRNIFTGTTLTALKNNMIWVVFAPTIATALGLIFAVLTERISWGTAFKVAVFMPMAISFLSVGVIWRLVYEQDPDRGLANAAAQGVVDVFRSPGEYSGARPSVEEALAGENDALATTRGFSPGETVNLGLVAIPPERVPEEAIDASPPSVPDDAIGGVVWLDFTRGGGGERGVVDPTEPGLPRMEVEALSDGEVVASASTSADGSFILEGLEPGTYTLRLPAGNFREPFGGFGWLGPTLVTPAIIVAFIWMWAGFAMVVIGAGLAAIPRDVLEAARVDGATEWQVFRRVTVPLLAPVLAVVVVTLVINVLKIFDLVFIIAPGSVQREANVIALQMWRTAFSARDFGLGSALAVFLFLLVVPAMLFNLRRFKQEQG